MTDAMPSPVRDAPRSAWRTLALAGALALGGCGEEGGAGGGGSGGLTGTGGSTARMTIVGDYLYAIAGSDVQLFDVSAPATPLPWVQVRLGRDIETLFPHGDYLLVGASEGVYVMDNTDAASPVEIGRFVHATARDPVVAQGTHAYLTLRADFTRPPPATEDRMEVLDIADPSAPSLVTTVAMESPAGLAVRDDRLYVCDGRRRPEDVRRRRPRRARPDRHGGRGALPGHDPVIGPPARRRRRRAPPVRSLARRAASPVRDAERADRLRRRSLTRDGRHPGRAPCSYRDRCPSRVAPRYYDRPTAEREDRRRERGCENRKKR